ncbi:MAG: carboxypeptidase regulatory-like domain-containing protein, partial [Kiritimatiellia bacterium]
MKCSDVAISLLLVVLQGIPLSAQSAFGVLRGFVLDSQGNSVPRARITIANLETGVERTLVSSEDGSYEAGYLRPGLYALSVEASGFKRFDARDIRVSGLGVSVFDARLSVGEVTASVTVIDEPSKVSEETGTVANLATREQYLNTPVNTRGSRDSYIFNFMSFVPGAQPSTSQFNLMFSGTRAGHNNFAVDGISSRSVTFGDVNGPAFPSMESILEVRTNLSGNSAEYGFPAQVTVVSRGGSNEWHGSAFWYYNSAGLNARPFFSPANPFTLLQNIGGSGSGPVVRNRTFLLGTYEYFEDRTSAQLNLNVPNENLRRGDFSQLLPAAIRDPLSGQPFPGNVIPSVRLNPVSQRIQDRFYPLPNFGPPTLLAGNFRDYLKQRQGRQTVDVRLDHHLGSRNSFWARGSYSRNPDQRIASLLPTIGFRNDIRETWNAVVSDTHIISSSIINEFRSGLSFQRLPSGGPIRGLAIVRELGLTALPAGIADVPAVPQFNISGFTSISMNEFRLTSESIWQIQNNVSWYRGPHTVKFGIDVWRNFSADHPTSPSAAYGNITFAGTFSGASYADFVLGIPRQGSRGAAGLWRSRRSNVD